MASAVSRRSFIGAASASGLALAGGGALAGCGGGGGGGQGSTATAPVARTPRRGGNLRMALPGGGSAETYEPGQASKTIDVVNLFNVFDPLIRVAGYETAPGLAVNWESNADATVWEIELREGVTWHDGKPFGPADVVYTFGRFANPNSLNTFFGKVIRLDEVKAVGKNKVRVPLTAPFAQFKDQFITSNAVIVQDGAKQFDKPVGTGPFKVQSWTPGRRSVLEANRDYWDEGKPYVDRLEIVSIDDETARLNALLAGEVDIISDLSYATAKAGSSGRYQVVLGAPGVNRTMYMRVDRPPFDDVRVRTAMKLIADRPAMIEAVYSGFGDPANDIWGDPHLKYYNKELEQRQQDIEQAKSLLKAAGQSDLRFVLTTSPAGGGFVQAATVYAQQCKQAGVTAEINRVQPSALYDPAQGYLKRPFSMSDWSAGSMTSIFSDCMITNAPNNETHYKSPEFDRLFEAAKRELDEAKAQELWNEVQRMMWEQSGYLIWASTRSSDAAANNVAGFGVGDGTGWSQGFGDFRTRDWGFTD